MIWGHTWNFRHCACVHACLCACVRAHTQAKFCVLNLSPRVLAGSTWNFFRSTIYELKLCTSYFWSACLSRPFVCERRRNLGPHSIWQFQVIFFSMFCPELTPTVLVGSSLKPIQIEYIWVEVVYLPLGAMSVHPFVCERCRNLGPHNILLIRVLFLSNVLSWTCPGVLVGSIWNLYRLNIYGLELCTSPWGRRRTVRFSMRVVGT